MEKKITSTKNPLIKEIRALAGRRHRQDRRRMAVEGIRLVEEVLEAGVPIEVLIYDPGLQDSDRGARLLDRARRAQVRLVPVLPRVIAACSQVKMPQGLIAVVEEPQAPFASVLETRELLLVVADRLQDPGNLGTIIRIADAVGASAVAVTNESVDPYSPKVIRATMGSIFHLPVTRVDVREAISALRARGVRVLVADQNGGVEYTKADYHRPVAIVLGNEAQGPGASWDEVAPGRVRIPLYGRAESLNVAVAAGILLYEARRQSP